jgi:hypothetical protein
MDSVGQLLQSLSMLDSHPSDMMEPDDTCDHVGSTAADTERDGNHESSTNSHRHVDRSTILRISVERGSGDEPPEERPVTLKRRYLITPIHHNVFTFIVYFIYHHFIIISILLYLCNIHKIT